MIPIGPVELQPDWKQFRFQLFKTDVRGLWLEISANLLPHNLPLTKSHSSSVTYDIHLRHLFPACVFFSLRSRSPNCTRTKRVGPSRSPPSFCPNHSESLCFSRTAWVRWDSSGLPASLQNTTPNIFSSDAAHCHIIHHRTNFLPLRCISSRLSVSAGPTGRSANPPETCSRWQMCVRRSGITGTIWENELYPLGPTVPCYYTVNILDGMCQR